MRSVDRRAPPCVWCLQQQHLRATAVTLGLSIIRLVFDFYLEAGEVRDARAADQVGDGLASVLDGAHQLLEILFRAATTPISRRFGVNRGIGGRENRRGKMHQ